MTTLTEAVEGRAWVFPEANLNTDLMMPSAAFRLPKEEQVRLVFSANRPGWVDRVRPGDLVVGGRNFGTGSSRPGAELLRLLGIAGLVAESINDLFYRNSVNYALPVLECPGILNAVSEGERLRIELDAGKVTNLDRATVLHGPPMPSLLRDIIAAGGLFEKLRAEGYI